MKLRMNIFLSVLFLCLFFQNQLIAQASAEAFFNKGNDFFEAGDFHNAADYYTEAIQLNNTYATAFFNRGFAYYKLEKYNKALLNFNQVIALDPNDIVAYEYRANTNFLLGKHEEALTDYNKIIAAHPSPNMLINRGIAYSRLQRHNEALADFNTVLGDAPNDSEALSNIGDVYFSLNQFEDAIQYYNAALKSVSNDELIYNNRANAYAKIDRHEEAIRDYDQAQHIQPHSSVLTNKGILEIELGDYENALMDCTEASILDYKNAEAYACVGEAKLRQQKPQEAIENLSKALDLDNSNPQTFFYRARAREIIEEYTLALEDYTLALALKPDFSDALGYRGLTKFKLEDYEGAVVDLEKALVIDPDFTIAKDRLNECLNILEKDKPVDTRSSSIPSEYNTTNWANNLVDHQLMASVETRPTSYHNTVPTFQEKGSTIQGRNAAIDYEYNALRYIEMEEYDNAILSYNKAILLDSNNPELYFQRGILKCELENFGGSIQDINTALGLGLKDQAQAYYHRGRAYLFGAEYDQAISDFNTTLTLDVTYQVAIFNRGTAKRLKGDREGACSDYTHARNLGLEMANDRSVLEYCR